MRRCCACARILPADADHFRKDSTKRGGIGFECRCCPARGVARRARIERVAREARLRPDREDISDAAFLAMLTASMRRLFPNALLYHDYAPERTAEEVRADNAAIALELAREAGVRV